MQISTNAGIRWSHCFLKLWKHVQESPELCLSAGWRRQFVQYLAADISIWLISSQVQLCNLECFGLLYQLGNVEHFALSQKKLVAPSEKDGCRGRSSQCMCLRFSWNLSELPFGLACSRCLTRICKCSSTFRERSSSKTEQGPSGPIRCCSWDLFGLQSHPPEGQEEPWWYPSSARTPRLGNRANMCFAISGTIRILSEDCRTSRPLKGRTEFSRLSQRGLWMEVHIAPWGLITCAWSPCDSGWCRIGASSSGCLIGVSFVDPLTLGSDVELLVLSHRRSKARRGQTCSAARRSAHAQEVGELAEQWRNLVGWRPYSKLDPQWTRCAYPQFVVAGAVFARFAAHGRLQSLLFPSQGHFDLQKSALLWPRPHFQSSSS